MGRAVRWVCAVVFGVSLFVGVAPVVADESSPWDGPAAAPPPSERMFDDPAFVAAMARALADHQAQEAQRASAAAQEQRLLSQTEFRGIDGDGALALARATFPALMRSDLDRLRLADDDRVAGFLSPNVARVVDERGDESLIVASDPVAAQSDGVLKPVDLDLVADGGAYAPDQAAVDVSVPRSADEYVRVGGEGLGVRAEAAAASAGTVSDGRVFYPDIAADTDFVAAPSRAGAEVMWQLRSPASPEQLGVDVDLPAGASIRLASPFWPSTASEGDAEIVSDDGTVQSVLTAPVAVDADGVAVPASFAFDEGTLVVRVAHRSTDVRYPILVDPEVRNVWGSSDFTASSCGGGATNFQPGVWSYQQWVTPFTPLCGNADGWGNGLFVRSEAMWYGDTARGQWIWSPPAGAYIMSMWLDGLRHMAAGTHLYSGLYGQTWGSVADQYGDMAYGQYTHVPNSPYNAWTAVVGLFMDGSYVRPHIGLAAVRGVNMRLGDLDPPGVSLASITGGLDSQTRSRWFDDSAAPAQVTVNANDGGLGLKTVEVVRDVTGARVGGVDSTCLGHRSSPCPRVWSPTFTLANQLPEGLTAIQTRSKDIVDNVASGPYWTQRIDRSAPTIDLSGTLVDHATDGQLGTNPSIYVHAIDGTTTSTATQRSGVKRVRLLLDNVVRNDYQAAETTCDNCDRGLTWTIPATILAGRHLVVIQAWDYLDHYAYRNFYVTGGPYWAAAQYGGANGIIDTDSEVDSVVNAVAAAGSSGRQALWGGLDQTSRDYYINNLLPAAKLNRKDFGFDSSDATTRSVFNDPTTQGTIAEYGTPMTSSEWASFSDEGPPAWAYDGPPNPDVLASTYNVSTDDGEPGSDSTANRGCDPTTETGCPDSSTAMTSSISTPSDPVTDDLDAVQADASSEAAVRAGAASSGFDRYGARADADAHARSGTERSGLYGPFGDSDCTNFVSQVWHLGGGLPMKKGWYIRWVKPGFVRGYSRSWPLGRDFVDYMVNDRQTSRLVAADITSFNLPSQAAIADAIEYDWGEGEGWSHLSVAVKTHTNIDFISQHSKNRIESLWNLGWQQQTNNAIRVRMKARVVHLRAP